MITTAGNPFGAMAMAIVILLSGIHFTSKLSRQIRGAGDRAAQRVTAATSGRRMTPSVGMGTDRADSHLASMAMLAAATTLNASPVTEWVLGRTIRPLSPSARRLMLASLNSTGYQQRMAYDRATYQWAVDRRLNRRNLAITGTPGVANAADALMDTNLPLAQMGSALVAAGADQSQVNLVLRARADLFNDIMLQQSFNLPVQKYLSAVRHVDGKQGSEQEFLGYLSVASVAASNMFAMSERGMYEIPTAALAPGASIRDRYLPYLDPASPRYSPYVATMIDNSYDRVTFRAAIAAAPTDFVFRASRDERNAVAAYWSRQAHMTARAWVDAPTSVAARQAVNRTRESIRNIEFELGPNFASPFTP